MAALVALDRHSAVPFYRQIYQRIRGAIAAGRLGADEARALVADCRGDVGRILARLAGRAEDRSQKARA